MFKSELFWKIIIGIVLWLITFALVSWLVDGSFWLHFFLTSAFTSYEIHSTIQDIKKEVKNLDYKTNIMDFELVRISPIVDTHEDRLDEVDKKLHELEDKIDESKRY